MNSFQTMTPRLGIPAVLIAFALLASDATGQDSSLLRAPSPSVQWQSPVAASRIAQAIQPGGGGSGTRFSPNRPSPLQPAPGGFGPGGIGPGGFGPGGPNDSAAPLSLDRVSWTHQPAPAIRTFQKNDVVTIRVDEITRVLAEGSAESRRNTLYQAILTDWIRLVDFRLRPDPQGNGDPSVGTQSNNNFRAESTVESRESLTFNIAATVVDIRPNGLLVLEARKGIRVNDNLWETSLTGICRAQDIAPDNVVLSKDLIDLEIRKDDRGHLRDGYQRGWFQRWFDRLQPF